MTLAEYYKKEKSGQSLQATLNEVHQKIKDRAISSKRVSECKTLQDFLNHAFYPEKYGVGKTGQDYTKTIQGLVEKAFAEKLNTTINNFSMGSAETTYGATLDTLPTLVQNLHETFEHKEKIYIATIEDRLQRVKDALQKTNSITGTEIEEYRSRLLKLQNDLNKLAELKMDAVNVGNNAYFDLKNKNSNLIDLINHTDNEFKALSSVGGIFGPQEYGQVLEWVLQAFSDKTNKAAEEIGNQMVKDFTKTAGSIKTGPSSLNLLQVSSIKFDDKNIVKIQEKPEETQKIIISDPKGGKVEFDWISSFRPDGSRQGKMDVDFKFNDPKTGKQIPFRISAKNWKTLDRDFGDTNVIYALLRSAGNNGAINYMLAMQDEKNQNNIDKAHRLAKYCLVADILMGLSQEGHFADTIVINVRQEKRVIVGSIIDILDNIWKNLKNFDLPTYPGSTINQKLTIIRNALNNTDSKSDQYYSLAMKYLQTIRVVLHYNSIKNAITTPLTT